MNGKAIGTDDWGQGYVEGREVAGLQETATKWLKRVAPPVVPEEGGRGSKPSRATPEAPKLPVPTNDGGVVDSALSVIGTVGAETIKFARDVPLQTVGAFRDVAQEMGDVTQSLMKMGHIGGIKVGDKGPEYVPSEEFKAVNLPEVPEGHSALAPFYRGVMRFALGFKGVGAAIKAGGAATGLKMAAPATKGGKFVADMGKSALADMVVWDEHESRLSDLVQEFPALQNPITEYLSTDMEDGMFEGKLKQALEGAGLGIAAKGAAEMVKLLARGVKAIKAGRQAKAGAQLPTEEQAVAREAEQAGRDIMVLGDPNAPLTRTVQVPKAESVIRGQFEKGVAGAGVDPVMTARAVLNIARTATAKAEAGKDGLDHLLDLVRGGGPKPPEGAKRLVSWLQANGGLREDGGELATIGISSKSRPGFVRENGKTLDDAAQAAWEAGYFPDHAERPDINDFLEAVRGDFSGTNPRHLIDDEAALADAAAYRQFGEELDRLGLDPNTMSNAEIRVKLEDLAAEARAADGPMGEATGRDLVDIEAENADGAMAGGKEVALVSKRLPNFARINGPADIDAVLREMAEANGDLIEGARGGTISREETIELARDVGLADVLQLEAGRFNRAEIHALKDFYAASADLVMKTAKLSERAPTEANLFAFRKALAVHQALLEKFTAARAEAGRTLNILGAVSQTGNTERLLALRDTLQAMGGPEVALALAKKVAHLENGSPEALNGVVRRGAAARTLDAVTEAWTLGLVSGVRTQGRNILSNAAYAFQRVVERGIAARMPGAEVEKGEALAMLNGMMWSMRQAFVNSGKAFWHGTSGFGMGKIDLPHRKAISGENFGLHGAPAHVADAFGELWRVWGRALNAGDEFFKTINYNGEVAALALRQARKSGATGAGFADEVARLTVSPTEEIRIAARNAARNGTFTQDIGQVGDAVQRLKASENLAVAIPARFMFPFVRTVANLTKAGIQHTPLAVAMPKTFWAEIKKGGASRDLALAKVAMGSAVMGLWSDMATRGIVTGNGPSDPTERGNWKLAGYRPYSIKIGDKWYNYRSIEPIGAVMGIAADITERLAEYQKLADSDDPDAQAKMDSLATATVAALGNSVLSQSFSRSMSEFFTVMSNPDLYADRWFQRTAKTVVPRIVPSIHEMAGTTGADEWKDVNSAYEAIVAELKPWTAIPVRDIYGHPYSREHGWPDILSAASPIYVGGGDGTPIAKEIYKQGIGIKRPAKKQRFIDPETGIGVNMDLREFPKVLDAFVRLQGNELVHPLWGKGLESTLNDLVEGKHDLSAYYESLPDGDEQGIEDKGAFIKGMFADYRGLAREAIMRDPEFEDFQRAVRERAIRQLRAQQGMIQ